MIIVTGDLHRNYDIEKLDVIAKLRPCPDIVLIAGDFGGVWHSTSEDEQGRVQLDAEDQDFIDALSARPFKILACPGNHENFDALSTLPETEAYGGRVIRLSDRVELLSRGYVFKLEDLTLFSLGGAKSMDWQQRQEHKNYWREEVITRADYERSLRELEKCNYEVDYVLTHTGPVSALKNMLKVLRGKDSEVREKLEFAITQDPSVHYLEKLRVRLKCTWWYFGHFHTELSYMSPEGRSFTCLYNKWHTLV